MGDFASKGAAYTLGTLGTVGFGMQLLNGNNNGGGGILGNLFGGNCNNQNESKENAILRERIAILSAENMAREAGTKAFTEASTYATGLVEKLAGVVTDLTKNSIAQGQEIAVLKSDIRCLATVNDKEHNAITAGYQSAVQLESERRVAGDTNLYNYVNATFVPGNLIMPIDKICPAPAPLYGPCDAAAKK